MCGLFGPAIRLALHGSGGRRRIDASAVSKRHTQLPAPRNGLCPQSSAFSNNRKRPADRCACRTRCPAFATPGCASRRVISDPRAFSHVTSLTRRAGGSFRKVSRRNSSFDRQMGQQSDELTRSRLASQSSSRPRDLISWQYALLLPCCVRANSSPPAASAHPAREERGNKFII